MIKRKTANKLLLKLMFIILPILFGLLMVLMLLMVITSTPRPNLAIELIPQYKTYANLMDADWQLLSAYDLAIHNNQAELLDPEAAAWFFLRIEYEGMNLSGKQRLLDYLGEDYGFEDALNHLNQLNASSGAELYKISARSIVSLETVLDKNTFKWVESLVSNNVMYKLSGEVNYSGANYGKLVLENKGFFAVPLPAGSYTVSSRGFGYRIHPVYKTRKFHSGQDFASPAGTPVGASADGTVKVGWDPDGYGNYVKIIHTNGFSTLYAHLLSVSVKNGESVRKGSPIGYVGSTGTSTGNHLHFEIRKDGQFLDPMKFLK